MPDEPTYTISELADLAGVTPRTIRYYLAQGLLPATGQSGPGTRYTTGHLARLRLIRRLQAEHQPLAEIRTRLADPRRRRDRRPGRAGRPGTATGLRPRLRALDPRNHRRSARTPSTYAPTRSGPGPSRRSSRRWSCRSCLLRPPRPSSVSANPITRRPRRATAPNGNGSSLPRMSSCTSVGR